MFKSFLLGALLALSTFFIGRLVNEIVPESYMDEIFHVPQAQAYCNGRYQEWNDKITTPPGLYMLTVPVLKIWHSIMSKQGEPFNKFCTPGVLRTTNGMLFQLTTYYVLAKLTRSSQHFSLTPLAICSFPLFYFFQFLYYTDIGSLFYVLLAFWLAKEEKFGQSAAAAFISLWFRQTNIVWAGFIAADAAVRLLVSSCYTSNELKSLIEQRQDLFVSLSGILQSAIKQPGYLVRKLWPFVVVLVSFLFYVKVNDGIVLGDKSNHVVAVHIPQIYYFCVFTALFSLPLVRPIAFGRSFLRTVTSTRRFWKSWKTISMVTVLGGMAYTVGYYTFVPLTFFGIYSKLSIEHPFLLSDNRHYTFYVWRKIFRRHPSIRYALVIPYLVCFDALRRALLHANKPLWWIFLFFSATAIALVPSPLLEFRYFLVPYVLFRLHLNPSAKAVLVEIAFYWIINAATLYLFLYRPFFWPHVPNTLQRFLW